MTQDAVGLAILANAFNAIAKEMGVILTRSAFSTLVREARDCSTAVLDAQGNLVAQGEMIPIHNGGLSEAFRSSAAQLDLSKVGPDNAIVLNDPYAGGQHLNDIIVFCPIMWDGELLGWVGNTAHHLDIGGGGAGINIDATELIQEGIIIPPLLVDISKDFNGGAVERLLFANVRTAEQGRGDFYAQLAANRTGIERVQELAARSGVKAVKAAMEETLNYAARRMKAAIATIPDGTWHGEGQIDSDVRGDKPLVVKVKVTVSQGNIDLDFAGSADQVKSLYNCSKASAIAAAMGAIRCILADKDIPTNDGCNRSITVKLPEGSIINPKPGHPVRARVAGAYRILDAVHNALAQAIPEKVPGQGYNSATGLYLVQKRENLPLRIYGDVLGGGYGGAPSYDGAHALAAVLSGSRNTPIESIEQIHPQVRVLHYKLLPDSGGAGQFRGGLGFARAIEILEDGIALSHYSDRFLYPPRGKNGGSDAKPGSLRVWRGDEVLKLRSADAMALKKGDIVELSGGGGAGWGDPKLRDKDSVASDLADGLITEEFRQKYYPQLDQAAE